MSSSLIHDTCERLSAVGAALRVSRRYLLPSHLA
jgi:hypothetical protein